MVGEPERCERPSRLDAPRRALLGAAAALAAVGVLTPLAPLGVDVHHDGIMLKTAADVASGQTIFRDTFTQYGALSAWIQAAALALAGERLVVLRYLTVLAYGLAMAALTATWARLLPPVLTVAAIATWFVLVPFYAEVWRMHPWSSAIALVFQCWALHAFVRSDESAGSSWWPLAAGACAALTCWARTPVGVLLTIALAMGWTYLAIARRHPGPAGALLWFCAGTVVTHALFFGVLAHQGTVGAWWEQTIRGPATWAERSHAGMGDVLPRLFPGRLSLIRLSGFAFWTTVRSPAVAMTLLVAGVAALGLLGFRAGRTPRGLVGLAVGSVLLLGLLLWFDPILVTTSQALAVLVPLSALGLVAWGAVRLVRGRPVGREQALGVALGIAGVASWAQYFPTNDAQHVFWAATPAVGLFVLAVHRLARERIAASLMVLGVLVLPLAVVRGIEMRRNLAASVVPVTGVPILSGMWAAPDVGAELALVQRELDRYTATRPDTPMAIVGMNALVATFVPDRRNVTPIFVQFGELRLDEAALSRTVARDRALVLVDPVDRRVAGRLARELGYRELLRTPHRIVLAPAESAP